MIYGYDNGTVNEHGLKEMREVTISAEPQALRCLAKFLLAAAEEMDRARLSPHWHRHSDRELQQALGCDVVVCMSTPSQ